MDGCSRLQNEFIEMSLNFSRFSTKMFIAEEQIQILRQQSLASSTKSVGYKGEKGSRGENGQKGDQGLPGAKGKTIMSIE